MEWERVGPRQVGESISLDRLAPWIGLGGRLVVSLGERAAAAGAAPPESLPQPMTNKTVARQLGRQISRASGGRPRTSSLEVCREARRRGALVWAHS